MSGFCAVSMRVTNATTYYDPRDAIAQDMVRWIERQDLVPVAVPNCLGNLRQFIEGFDIESVVLSGGNNAVASRDGDPDVAPDRTRTETELIKFALERRLPVLGLCRGMHMINLYFGGEVLSSISDDKTKHVAVEHDVHLSGRMAALAGADTIRTNSFHNQGIRLTGLARDLEAFAVSQDDGVIEGLTHKTDPVLGVQWHPERTNPAAQFDDLVLGRFLKEGAFWRQ